MENHVIVSETFDELYAGWRMLATHNPSIEVGPWLAVAAGPGQGTNHGFLTAPGGGDAIGEVESLFDRLELPFVLEIPEQLDPGVEEKLLARGYVNNGPAPLMRVEAEQLVPPAREIDLEITQVTDGEPLRRFLDVAAAGFDMPLEEAEAFSRPWMVNDPDAGYFLGVLNGEPVGTSVALCTGKSVGVFMVATLEAARGKGVGAALTVRAARSGFERGKRFAYLQSSTLGYGVYKRLGFRTVARSMWYARASNGEA